jgi:serine/threonine-protein kinase
MPSAPKVPAQKPDDIQIGDVVLERYRVVEQIGTGGHSIVFKGRDERLSRPVCIKVFSGLGGQSGVGRTSYEHFVQEAFALSRLTHPNTLRIYDFGHLGPKDADGMPLQVCEYMNGGTLSQIIREQGKQPLVETVRVIGAMCAALAEAHALGIVHRDIKPQNILFGSVGGSMLPKLADFGIAKWSTETEDTGLRAEDTAVVAGQKLAMYSPSWAAPEQLAGQTVSAATDIYSLACVAIYMMSGRAIFAEEDVYAGYKKRRHADEHVRDALRSLDVPRSVIDVLSRALAFDPKKRLPRVEDLSAGLQSAIEPPTDESARPPVVPGKHELITAPASPITGITTPEGRALEEDEATPVPPAVPVAPPPGPPPADLTPATFHAPVGVQPWMAVVSGRPGPARWLMLSDAAQPIADRRGHFIMLTGDSADLVGPHGTKVRVTLVPGPTGQRVVHVKGLTCFVALLGGRPSPAVQLHSSSDVALVTPAAQEIGHLRVAQGMAAPGQVTFMVGNECVAVATDDCVDPILFDFGPGSDAYFVYTRGRPAPKSGRRG